MDIKITTSKDSASMKTPQEQSETELWYSEYYRKRGEDRNDILRNSGVLFQNLALIKSVIEALRNLSINRDTWKILDVGCGDGGSLLPFLSFGFPVQSLYGIDIMSERVSQGVRKLPNINFCVGDASHMDYQSGEFDLVMESTMFIQISDDDLSRKIAGEMLRVVKLSGYILLTDWRYSYRHPEYKALSKSRIASLFSVGTRTTLVSSHAGALIPPIGRKISSCCPSLYFIVQKIFPFLTGQLTTVLQKLV
jgi:ubiquinone/menaquinone biosynthesis C-methylase UbiE